MVRILRIVQLLIERIKKSLLVTFDNSTKWVKTNWSKVVTKLNGVVVHEQHIYESRCWRCKKPIKSVLTTNRMFNWRKEEWAGDKKCQNLDCNYFVCSNCGMCLCDGPYAYLKERNPYPKIWKEEGIRKYKIVVMEYTNRSG